MPVYVNTQAMRSLDALGEGVYYPTAGDQSGNTYIRQQHFPASLFTFSNLPSKYAASSVTGTVQTSGTVYVTPIYLPGGFTVQNLSVVTGTTTSSALTHRWYCLFDSALVLRASTADDTTAVPTVSSIHTLPIAKVAGATATAYKIPTTLSTTSAEGMPTLYYFGIMLAGTTIGSLANVQAPLYSVGVVPKSGSTDLTGKTVALTTDGSVSVATITGLVTVPWVGVS